MFNPAMLLKLKKLKDRFLQNHPKLAPFFRAVRAEGVREGMVVELTVTTTAGQTLRTNIRVQESDVELYREIEQLLQTL